jgi:DNA-binding NtrC family response regulator
MRSKPEILVVDDEDVMCESLAAWLREDGYSVATAASGHAAVEMTRAKGYALYFVDLKMPGGMDGIETMAEIRRLHPNAAIVIVTAYATIESAIKAIKQGAQEYVVKPYNPEEISLLASRILRIMRIERENAILRKRLMRRNQFRDILSKNARMHEIFRLIRDIARLRSTVLIQGESGTGKELVARAIHESSDRAAKPFVPVACAALAESLLETELFGHEKGAFTGASALHRGKFEIAQGGTVFLDEIGDISPKLQLDLLRVLEGRRFFRVGGSEEIELDVRMISATNVDLQAGVREGRFRDDLFYRLDVINIHLPALRERREDVPILASHFLNRFSQEIGREPMEISEDALALLLDYDWPGNVRELQNAVERAVATCLHETLRAEDFEFLLRRDRQVSPEWAAPTDRSLEEVEKQVIAATLQRHLGNISETAGVLGIDRSTLYEKIRKYQITR